MLFGKELCFERMPSASIRGLRLLNLAIALRHLKVAMTKVLLFEDLT